MEVAVVGSLVTRIAIFILDDVCSDVHAIFSKPVKVPGHLLHVV